MDSVCDYAAPGGPACVPPNPVSCDDQDPCTIDGCDAEVGCTHQVMAACTTCTGDTDPKCNDNDPCTTDSCVDALDGNGTPVKGCSHKPKCDDNDPLSLDACDPVTGNCIHVVIPICSCAVDSDCMATDVCHETKCDNCMCTYHDIDCSDTILCTIDTCDPTKYILGDPLSACVHELIPGCDPWCSDLDCLAWVQDACEVSWCDKDAGGCVFGPRDCDDGDTCTVDTCDPSKGGCVHENLPPPECQHCPNSAHGPVCQTDVTCPIGGVCRKGHCQDTWECLPKDCCHFGWCDDTIDPVKGLCVQEPIVCDNGDKCQVGSCDPGECNCVFDSIPVDDGDPCTYDYCDGGSGEVFHMPKWCIDEDPCTLDSCDPVTGSCVFETIPGCQTCSVQTPGSCADAALACSCCPWVGSTHHCLCSSACKSDADCMDATRPTCQRPSGGTGFCAPTEFSCCWLCA
jgi:hypothetical protein